MRILHTQWDLFLVTSLHGDGDYDHNDDCDDYEDDDDGDGDHDLRQSIYDADDDNSIQWF